MRTKKLLLLAAALAAGITTSQAQAVYSQNTVGYINVFMTNGYNMVANQLDFDGLGTNNTLQSVFSTNLPNGTAIYAFTNGGYLSSSYSTSGGGKWGGNASTNACNYCLQPGRGVYVKWPATALATNFTFIGNVMQGAALSNNLTLGFQFASSQVPQGGRPVEDLGFAPVKTDALYRWNSTNQSFNSVVSYNGSKWGGAGEPTINTGEAIYLNLHSGAKWVRNFTVQ